MKFVTPETIQEHIQDAKIYHIFETLVVSVKKTLLLKIMLFFKENLGFDFLIDIVCADYPEKDQRFEITYIILNIEKNQRCFVKITTEQSIETITSIFCSANWYERELYDQFGIQFNEKKERILNELNFEGFPLRKDFPEYGKVECIYDIETQKVKSRSVKLEQESRVYDTLSSWSKINQKQPNKNLRKNEKK